MLLSSVTRFSSQNARLCRQISSCSTKQLFNKTLGAATQNYSHNKQHDLQKHTSLPITSSRSLATYIKRQPHSGNFFLRQFFDRESCTYSYLLADAQSKEAVIIDPVIDLIERDFETVVELGLDMKYALSTHEHSDHMEAAAVLKKRLPRCKTVISAASGAKADILVRHGDIIKFGGHNLEVRATPGHTNGCVTYVCHAEGVAFTGDTLLIRGCGRTDFKEGNPETLYDSIFNQIFSLPNNFRLYPGHDYRGRTVTTVMEEKRYNPRLNRSRQEFIQLMKTLNLAYTNQMEHELPSSFQDGPYTITRDDSKLKEENMKN